VGAAVVGLYTLFPHLVIALIAGHRYEAIAPYLGRFGLAMLGLALANVLVYYFVATHQRRFLIGLLVGAGAFVGLLLRYHATLDQFTAAVTGAIDLMAVVLLLLYLAERPHRAHLAGAPA
jgi:hypothetical protein